MKVPKKISLVQFSISSKQLLKKIQMLKFSFLNLSWIQGKLKSSIHWYFFLHYCIFFQTIWKTKRKISFCSRDPSDIIVVQKKIHTKASLNLQWVELIYFAIPLLILHSPVPKRFLYSLFGSWASNQGIFCSIMANTKIQLWWSCYCKCGRG